jgi:hypothetical protein
MCAGFQLDLSFVRRAMSPLVSFAVSGTLHEEGVSVNTIRIRLGHESLDVTLAYLKGKDAESEEAQEHANSSSLALYA